MSREFRTLVAALVAVVLTAGACGSRLDKQELEAANGPLMKNAGATKSADGAGVTELGLQTPGGETGAAADVAGVSGSGGATASAGGASGSSRSAGATPGAASGASAQQGAGAGGSAAGATSPGQGGTPKPGSAAAAVPGAPSPGAPVPGGKKSEIVLGSFGAESGILGAVSGPAPPAIRAWAAYINTIGGINGHPVRVILGDDGADPSRSQAIVRKMVEQDKVIAFFNDYSFTLPSVLPYLEQKQIPIIGSIGGDSSGDHSPMMFNPMVGPDVGQAWGFILNTLTLAKGKKKIGILYCREANICAIIKDGFKKLLPYEGLEVVYEAFVSLAQPDYTGEMIQAQRAGAEVILPLMDTAALNRLAQSAHRQNYKPVFVGTYNLNQDLIYPFSKELEGTALTARVGAWDTNPKLAFYREAMARFQPKAARGDLGAGVFVTGRLLAEKIGPFIQEPPTTAQILDGLYSLKNEKLDGLLPGIGFEKGQEHVKTNQCVVPVLFSGGKFVPHDAAGSFVCAPGWKPVGT
jgi:branched-chain amino acid transport system substrate-binding protein